MNARSQYIGESLASHPQLWSVNDAWLGDPSQKLERHHNALIEYTVEQWSCYPFDNAKVPVDMVTFAKQFLSRLRLTEPITIPVAEICEIFIHRFDYHDPYFFLVDTLIKASHNELTHTYRDRKTGDILDPSKIETFELVQDWKFGPFMHIGSLFRTHPLFAQNRWGEVGALQDFLKKACEVVFGDWRGFTEYFVEEAREEWKQHQIYEGERSYDPSEVASLLRNMDNEIWQWQAIGLAVAAWIKSPNAVAWLTTYHPVYDALLQIKDNGQVVPWAKTGNEAIIDGACIYTHEHLEFLQGRKPDTCACCGADVHCTKYMNLTALFNPLCSCGQMIDPLDVDRVYDSHNQRPCQPYKAQHQIRLGFVCQRCIWVAANQQPSHTKCGRTICPAVRCPHHLGPNARIQALTVQRTKQLTPSQCG
jgi:hypothetical protein